MTSYDQPSLLIEQLLDCLKKEQEFLLQNGFDEILNLKPQKEALLDRLDAYMSSSEGNESFGSDDRDIDPEKILQIRQLADTNNRVSNATLIGLKSARKKIEAIFENSQSLKLYSDKGENISYHIGTQQKIQHV